MYVIPSKFQANSLVLDMKNYNTSAAIHANQQGYVAGIGKVRIILASQLASATRSAALNVNVSKIQLS